MTTGRYSRVREIGRGGTGAVWLGEDRVLERDVALKRVGVVPGGVEPDMERAEREARLAAALNHPHVVAVFDLITEGEDQWLVMEYVEGTSLADLIRAEGPLDPERSAALLVQAADALTAAHAAGIVHRDVKPSNILVTPEGQAKLTDFGIARAEADATLTQTGLVTGSPAYLSPEVAAGRSATPASDVWALGATLFHCLAGRPPYEVGDNILGAMYRIVHEAPPRLADAGRLAPLLEHTMATDPADRWSMHEARDFLRGETTAGATTTATATATATEVMPTPLPGAAATTPDEPTPDEPTPDEPLPVEPALESPTTTQPSVPPPARRSWWPWAALGVTVVALSIVAFMLGMGDGRDREAARDVPSATDESATPPASEEEPEGEDEEPTPAPTEEEDAGDEPPSAEEMEVFVTTYLDTVTTDPRATWEMLTPEFQDASGNFGRYRNFWRTIADAQVNDVRPDPAGSTVSYDVTYEMADGSVRTDSVSLRLVRQDGVLKIASES